jgi:hypothetical protein
MVLGCRERSGAMRNLLLNIGLRRINEQFLCQQNISGRSSASLRDRA